MIPSTFTLTGVRPVTYDDMETDAALEALQALTEGEGE